jgi:hypothetical protein
MPIRPRSSPLGRGDVDVARPGDDVDRLQHGPVGVDAAVREQRDALRPADRPHLLDAQQRGRRQHRRVRQPAVLGLRRRGQHERLDPGRLGRDHVHQHAGRVDGQPAGGVEADPADRDEPLGHHPARDDLGDDVGAALVGVHGAGPGDRELQRGADRRVERGQRPGQRRCRDPDGGGRTR